MLHYQNFKTCDASLLMVYFTYFHSIMSYGIIFLGTPIVVSIHSDLKKKVNFYWIQKESRRNVLGKLNILTLYSQNIFSLLCLVISNKDQYIWNLDVHGRNTRYGLNLNPPTSNLALYQKSTHYMGPKVFNSLPTYIRINKMMSMNLNDL
jgi:hypothetical protein